MVFRKCIFWSFRERGAVFIDFSNIKGSSNEVRLYVFKATSPSYPHSCIYSMDLFKSFSWEHLVRIGGFCSAHFGLTIKWPALGFAHGFGISSFLSFSWFRLKSLFLSDTAACGEQRGKMWVDFLRFLTLKEILFDLHGFPHALFLKWYTFL